MIGCAVATLPHHTPPRPAPGAPTRPETLPLALTNLHLLKSLETEKVLGLLHDCRQTDNSFLTYTEKTLNTITQLVSPTCPKLKKKRSQCLEIKKNYPKDSEVYLIPLLNPSLKQNVQ